MLDPEICYIFSSQLILLKMSLQHLEILTRPLIQQIHIQHGHIGRPGLHPEGLFEKPLPRRKIRKIASAVVKTKVKLTDLKVVEPQGNQNLLDSLLYISTLEKTDLEKVFKSSLTPVPLSLANLHGSINKADKGKEDRKRGAEKSKCGHR